MKWLIPILAVAAVLLAGSRAGAADAAFHVTQGASASVDDSSARAVLDAVNAERSRRGVARLTLDSRLNRAAAVQARDLASHGRFSHNGSDGSSVGERADRAGYRWSRVGENLARAAPSASAADVVRMWMNSSGHRANILNARFNQMGVAHQGRIWVLVLARPLRTTARKP